MYQSVSKPIVHEEKNKASQNRKKITNLNKKKPALGESVKRADYYSLWKEFYYRMGQVQSEMRILCQKRHISANRNSYHGFSHSSAILWAISSMSKGHSNCD